VSNHGQLQGLCECGGCFLVSEFSVECGVCELAGVEDFSCSFGVDGVAGESLCDLVGDLEDGVAIAEGSGEGESAVGVDEDGRGRDAVSGAEVFALDGGGGASGVVGEVLEALVEVVGSQDVGLGLVHGVPPPRGLWKTLD